MIIDINKDDELVPLSAVRACQEEIKYVAEGQHGWEREFHGNGIDMLAVQKLRKDYEDYVHKVFDGGCAFAGHGRGDCEHYVGFPDKFIKHDEPNATVDVHGKINGWCSPCWNALKINILQKKIETISNLPSNPPAVSAKHVKSEDITNITKIKKELSVEDIVVVPDYKKQLDDEAWMHAACLSISEGYPGWDHKFHECSPAMLSVQRLRKNYQDALSRIRQLESSTCYAENSTNLFPPCSIKDGEQPTANPLSPLKGYPKPSREIDTKELEKIKLK